MSAPTLERPAPTAEPAARAPRGPRKPPRLPRPQRRPAPTKTKVAAWPDDVRERAVKAYAERGLAAASAEVGVPKGTIRDWAKKAGVDASAVHAAAGVDVERATEAAVRSRRQKVAEARDQLVTMQAQIALTASALELEILDAHRAYLTSAAEGTPDVKAAARLQAAMAGPHLTQVVGSRTRAIHDLQLLDGKATEQPEGGLTIVFASPPIAPGPAPTIVTLEGEVLSGGDS